MAFHDAHPTVALSLNVTRIPFSFLGQQPADQDRLTLKRKGIWHDRLMDYAGNPAGRDQFEAQMAKLGEAAGVTFDFNAYIDRQPIESQRLLLWAGRFGKGEEFMTALSNRHFQQGSQGESASKRPTLLAAAQEAGLDAETVTAFLDSDELHDEVWRSYGEMPRKGINAIPLFCFSVPEVNLWSGPFRDANADATVNGSGDMAQFLYLFKQLYKHTAKVLGETLKRDEAPSDAEAGGAGDGAAQLRVAGCELSGQEVRLVGLQAKPELNGAVGACERFDEQSGRYAVRIPRQEQPILVRATNLELVDKSGGDKSGKEEL